MLLPREEVRLPEATPSCPQRELQNDSRAQVHWKILALFSRHQSASLWPLASKWDKQIPRWTFDPPFSELDPCPGPAFPSSISSAAPQEAEGK